ncbi:MAG: DUF2505 domain-containing protein [Ornithinimicrobium sp.]
MRITERLRHAASVSEVFAMLRDPAYQELRCERSGSLEHEVTIEEPVDEASDGPTVVTRRRMATDDFPDAAKSLIGHTVDIVETTSWGAAAADGTREAGLSLSVEQTPVNLVGGVHLAPDGDETVHSVDGELSAHVPFIGGKIERAISPFLTKAIELEEQLGREWLAR